MTGNKETKWIISNKDIYSLSIENRKILPLWKIHKLNNNSSQDDIELHSIWLFIHSNQEKIEFYIEQANSFLTRNKAVSNKERFSEINNIISEIKNIKKELINLNAHHEKLEYSLHFAEDIKKEIEKINGNKTDTSTPEPAVKKINEKFNSAIFNQPYFIVKEKEIFVKIIEQLNGHKIIFTDFETPITLKTNERDLITPLFGLLKAMENKKIITGLQSTTAKNMGEDVIKFFNYCTKERGTDNYRLKQFRDGHTTYISNPQNHENKTFKKSVAEFENLIDEAIEKKN